MQQHILVDLHPRTKRVKIDSLPQDESTKHLSEDTQKQPSPQTLFLETIPFLSLEQRFGAKILPLHFKTLIISCKKIIRKIWKSRAPLDLEMSTFEALQIGQIIKIDSKSYHISEDNKLTLNEIDLQKLPKYDPLNSILPENLNQIVERLETDLIGRVKQEHEKFLEINELNGMKEFYNNLSTYHPGFDLSSIEMIEPEDKFKFPKLQFNNLDQIVETVQKYYETRKVSYAYYESLTHFLKQEVEIDESHQYIGLLLQLSPDFIKVCNKKEEQMKSGWIVQINKKMNFKEIQKRLTRIFI